MLFDTISESTVTNWDAIEPSKYEANLEGALMLVYENECNYNALMRAAGLSELKYYQETGGDLFVQEAGAFGGFLEKAKSFFKAVLEKIKALFKKFFMAISQFVMSDKEWVKKYEKDILRSTNIKDMEFKGYKFNNLDASVLKLSDNVNKSIDTISNQFSAYKAAYGKDTEFKDRDSDKIDDIKEMRRARLLGDKGQIDETEFRDKLKEMLYGDSEKELLDDSDINLREQLNFIKETKDNVKSAEKFEKNSTKAINDIIKEIERYIKDNLKFTSEEQNDKALSEKRSSYTKILNQQISIYKSVSNDITTGCGMVCQAYKDRNRQAKAICIKAVSYNAKHKNESTVYADPDDLFAGVTIR